jgi:hypothetical protein
MLFPGRTWERTKGSACRSEGIGLDSFPESEHAVCRRHADAAIGVALILRSRDHAPMSGDVQNDDALNGDFLLKNQTYDSLRD